MDWFDGYRDGCKDGRLEGWFYGFMSAVILYYSIRLILFIVFLVVVL